MDKNKAYTVKNRSASRVVYTIPEEGIRREFAPGETKKLTYWELEKLSFQPGGRNMMNCFLQIISEKATEALNLHTEPEYWMSEENIVDVILKAPLPQFLDCLDYAPIGAIDLIKKLAVSLPMTDMQKMEALKEKTGFDTAKAIAMTAEDSATEADSATTAAPTRRRTAASYKPAEAEEEEEAKPTTTAPTYKIVSEN